MYRNVKIWLATACLLLPLFVVGQTIENVKTSFDGEKMVITYDLNYSDPATKFKVSIYSSHDNYERPLSLLIGDFGDNVVAGKGNRVIWDAKSSLPADFDNNIMIKIKAVMAVPLVKLSMKPFDQSSYKRGTPIEVRWVGGNPTDKLNIELFKDGQIVQRIASDVENNQHFTWNMPRDEKAGKQYVIRISNSKQATDLSNSQLFDIKPRTALIVKILPFIVVGGVVVVILNSGKSPKGDAKLPAPINPN